MRLDQLIYKAIADAFTGKGDDTMKKWTQKQLQKHIKTNLGDDPYSPMVIIAALYKKIYGEFPKIGMSGFQADAANSVLESLQ